MSFKDEMEAAATEWAKDVWGKHEPGGNGVDSDRVAYSQLDFNAGARWAARWWAKKVLWYPKTESQMAAHEERLDHAKQMGELAAEILGEDSKKLELK